MTESEERQERLSATAKIAVAVALGTLLLTVILSAMSVGMDFSKISIQDLAVKIAINVVLSLLLMSTGETFMTSYVSLKSDGMYQQALDDFKAAKKSVENFTNRLGQYLSIQYEKAVKNAEVNYLIDHGVPQAKAIMMLDLQDIPNLSKPFEKTVDGKTYKFKSHTKKQIEAIRKVLSGEVVVERVPKSFYLDANSDAVGRDDYVMASYIVRKKKVARHGGRVFQVMKLVFSSILLAAITVSDMMNANDPQVWADLIGRVLTCIGGFYAGCVNSNRVNRIECVELRLKTKTLTELRLFMEENPNRFPKTDEEAEGEAEVYETMGKKPEEATI